MRTFSVIILCLLMPLLLSSEALYTSDNREVKQFTERVESERQKLIQRLASQVERDASLKPILGALQWESLQYRVYRTEPKVTRNIRNAVPNQETFQILEDIKAGRARPDSNMRYQDGIVDAMRAHLDIGEVVAIIKGLDIFLQRAEDMGVDPHVRTFATTRSYLPFSRTSIDRLREVYLRAWIANARNPTEFYERFAQSRVLGGSRINSSVIDVWAGDNQVDPLDEASMREALELLVPGLESR